MVGTSQFNGQNDKKRVRCLLEVEQFVSPVDSDRGRSKGPEAQTLPEIPFSMLVRDSLRIQSKIPIMDGKKTINSSLTNGFPFKMPH
jgi:hypothetical protein